MTSSQSGQIYTSNVRDSKSSISSERYGHSQISATESSRGDDFHDEMDNDSLGGRLICYSSTIEVIFFYFAVRSSVFFYFIWN